MKTLQDVAAQSMAAYNIREWGVCEFAPLRERLLSCRAAARLPQNAASVLVALFPYRFPDDGAPRNLSRYACVEDYHYVVGVALAAVAAQLTAAFPAYRFVPFCDNSPVPEVPAAVLAGLGVVGDNGLLLNPTFGSYVFIGTIVTDAPFAPTIAAPETLPTCSHCGRCAAACPSGCLGGDGDNADKSAHCLSAVTQKKGAFTSEEAELVQAGGLCWGCDRCQEVCPVNEAAKIEPYIGFPVYTPWLSPDAADDPLLPQRPYGWRGAAVLRRNLELLYGEK